MGDGFTDILADGSNSVVVLTSLRSYNLGGGRYGYMEARNGGTIVVPQLAQAPLMRFTLRPERELALPALRQLYGGSLTVAPGMSVELPGLVNIDHATCISVGEECCRCPGWGSYQSSSGRWQVSGAGSRLVLAGLTNAVFGSGNWHYIEALSGGRVELAALAAMGDGFTDILADGSNSVVVLTSLRSYNLGGGRYGYIEARNGGRILLSNPLEMNRMNLTVRGTGVIQTWQISRLRNATVTADGAQVDLRNIYLKPQA